MKLKSAVMLLTLAALTNSLSAQADEAEEKAKTIMQKVEANASGFKDMQDKLKMVVTSQEGSKSEREMQIKALAETDGGSRSMTLFTKPKRDAGVGLLNISDKDGNEGQWVFLPSSKKIKKITSSSKSSYFWGSDFTYEDLSNGVGYQYKFVGEQACGDKKCYVIDRFPGKFESAYAKTTSLIETDRYLPLQATFYDDKNQIIKTLTFKNYIQHQNKYWKPESIEMVNSSAGSKTELTSLEIKFDQGLNANAFSEQGLERAAQSVQ